VLPITMGVQFLLQAIGLDVQSQPTHALHSDLLAAQEAEQTTVLLLRTARAKAAERMDTQLPARPERAA
jgi:hypothetical protein